MCKTGNRKKKKKATNNSAARVSNLNRYNKSTFKNVLPKE